MRSLFVIAILGLLTSCGNSENSVQSNKDGIILKVTHDKPVDTVVLKTDPRYKLYDQPDTIITYTGENSILLDTINIPKGYYELSSNNKVNKIYLQANSRLEINNLDTATTFKGDLADINRYIAVREGKNRELRPYFSPFSYGKLTEKEFLRLNDSIYSVFSELVKNLKNLPEAFRSNELNIAKIEKANQLLTYTFVRPRNEKDYEPSENYPAPLSEIDLNNEELLNIDRFRVLLWSYANVKASKTDMETWEYILSEDFPSKNPKVKQEVFYTAGIFDLPRMRDPDGYYEKSQQFLEAGTKRNELTEKYYELKKIGKGFPAPEFQLTNLEGEPVALKDFKGSVVYLDFWSNSCKPCIEDMPEFKKLQKDFENKDVKFISIAITSNRERVESILEKNKMTGIQLFQPGKDKELMKDYAVTSIPRYVLVDRDGNIWNHIAPRPTDPELKEQLNKLLGS
ncbi:thiol-disulfide isomerase/thioredoxin [Christiangramia gaetbulicola]|uniref:Thiol-disulfide isomerase/thioredoxin n=1 Tax=Christiangramia gaetbulicola TaxID=703340 RepID=A0A2T6AL90_9FLAO|nr:TlpA disulfide reductase family protein [Christiangramia gaetbulicola]PTX44588.1 thiol-disulfide isomerase/thioredoxin [Christiangramia gaetbulicola]